MAIPTAMEPTNPMAMPMAMAMVMVIEEITLQTDTTPPHGGDKLQYIRSTLVPSVIRMEMGLGI
jgi:hypothetical protein